MTKEHSTTDPKYVIIDNRICNSHTKQPIAENEPVFIFRAKDKKALRALRGYASTCTNETHQRAIFGRITDFEKFRDEHGTEEPDTIA